jgi:hypothetical protein
MYRLVQFWFSIVSIMNGGWHEDYMLLAHVGGKWSASCYSCFNLHGEKASSSSELAGKRDNLSAYICFPAH